MHTQLYIDGRWRDGGAGLLDVENPATEEVFAQVAEASSDDVEAAVIAARNAFDDGPWGQMAPRERAAALRRLLDALWARKDQVIDLAVTEGGVPRSFAPTGMFQVPLEHFEDMVERVLRTFPFSTPMPPTFGATMGQGEVIREAAGVVAAITPFNYPFLVNLSKVAPCLAAGCTIVLKPAPTTPLSALVIAEAVEEADLPPGVLNVVTGDVESGRVLTSHPAVDVVSFTGSIPIGREIMRQAAGGVKRVLLELGGKNADIILGDVVDLDRVVADTVGQITRNTGQGCGNMSRILIQDGIYDEFVERLVVGLGQVRVGDPDDPSTQVGPLISSAHRARVERYIAIGKQEGAPLRFGGGRPANLERGYFVEPTLFVDVKNSMTIAREEIFGPVGSVIRFSDDAEALAITNDSTMGLRAMIWSGDPKRAYKIGRQIRAGTIYLNGISGGTNPYSPLGGYKQSGIGREFGESAISEYLETKGLNWGVAGV